MVYHASPGGFRLIDVSNPGDPTIIASLAGVARGYGVAVDSTFAYIAAGDGLTIVDIADPGAPAILSHLTTRVETRQVDLLGDHAYLSVPRYGLDIVDISDRESPHLVGTLDLPVQSAFGVEMAPPYAYVAGGQSLQVLDVSDPIAPVLIGQIWTAVTLSLFTAKPWEAGILVEWATSRESSHVGFQLRRRSAKDEEYRLLTEDLIPPPGPYAFLDRDTISFDTYEYVLEAIDRRGGVQRFGPVTARAPGATSLRIASWPNPLCQADLPMVIHASVPASGSVKLELFDVRGRLVRSLWTGGLARGDHHFSWDGRDAAGRGVPSGNYFYRLASQGATVQSTVVLVR
jgi:hypothetical protein